MWPHAHGLLPGAHSTGQSALCFFYPNQQKLYQKKPFEGVPIVHPIVPVEHEPIKSSTGAAEPHRPVRHVLIVPFATHHRTPVKVVNEKERLSQL